MLTATRQTKAAEITRTIGVGLRLDLSTYAVVTETTHQRTKDKCVTSFYTLKRIPTDFGIGVEIVKEYQPAGVGAHHVHLDPQLGDSCTCADHVYRSCACRHLEMVREAIRRGLV